MPLPAVHVIIRLCALFSTRAREGPQGPFDSYASLNSSYIHWPERDGTFPLLHCSSSRIKDCPY